MLSPPRHILPVIVLAQFAGTALWFAGNAVIGDLQREDLDGYSVEGLKERIAGLEAEIARTRAAMEGKSSQRSAADALFNFRP